MACAKRRSNDAERSHRVATSPSVRYHLAKRVRAAGLLERANFSTKVFAGLSHGLIREDTGWLEPECLESLARFIGRGEGAFR